MPANTSKNKSSACRCDQNCGCCLKKKSAAAKAEPGFLGKRPWLFVVFAFMLLFSAWGALFYIAIKHRPETVPLVTLKAE